MRSTLVAVIAVVIAACGDTPDGGSCDDDGDCALGRCGGAGFCTDGVCDGLDDPGCPGPERECVARDGTLFDADDLCLLLCVEKTCPDLYFCDGGAYCTYTGIRVHTDPASPSAGAPTTFTAELVGETAREWSWIFFVGGTSNQESGEQTTQTLPAGSFSIVVTAAVPVGEFGQEGRQHELTVTVTE